MGRCLIRWDCQQWEGIWLGWVSADVATLPLQSTDPHPVSCLDRSITKEDVTCLKTPPLEEARKIDRMRDIGRSQTVPRSFGAQSRRAAMQKADAQKD
eukprot:g18639.t1